MEEFDWNDVSKYYRPNMLDQNVAMEISRHWATPEAIRVFARRCGQLTADRLLILVPAGYPVGVLHGIY